jgi:hypothetical protein
MVQVHRDLPDLTALGLIETPGKEKISVVLGLLRRTAAEHRKSTGRPFYSIRTVARHFNLPSTTVIRLYDQLKVEGVLGSVWGSKTIIEPDALDNDIRLRAMIALPVPLRAFSALSAYRDFLRSMQRALWTQRFGSQVIFYDDALVEGCTITDALLEMRPDIIVWLMPPQRTATCLARVKDRGAKPITIIDEIPINGEPGYYLDWQEALISGLAAWKLAGIRKVIVTKEAQSNCSNTLRRLHSCLEKAGFAFEVRDTIELKMSRVSVGSNAFSAGVIFSSAQSLIEFAQAGMVVLEGLLRHNRVVFVHGGIDLPFKTQLNCLFDTLKFDWTMISRRIVSDLVARCCATQVQRQMIFKAKWSNRSL